VLGPFPEMVVSDNDAIGEYLAEHPEMSAEQHVEIFE
jgi:hypothetical protein